MFQKTIAQGRFTLAVVAVFAAIVEQAFQDEVTASALCGWVDCRADDDFTAFAFLVDRDGDGKAFNTENIYGNLDQ